MKKVFFPPLIKIEEDNQMIQSFSKDLKKGKRGEIIVYNYLKNKNKDLTIQDVSTDRKYFHMGDIRLITKNGDEYFFEVKNDECIGKTRNVLCEEKVYYFADDQEKKGFMYSDYTNYCIVSESERKIYLIDFQKLKEIYKSKGQYRYMSYAEQASDVYLVPLAAIEEAGALISVANY